MGKYFSKFTKDDLAGLLMITAFFIFTFAWSLGWILSILSGIAFGIGMILLFGWIRDRQKSKKSQELIVLEPPKFLAYFIAVGFHFFVFITVLAFWTEFEDRTSLLLPTLFFSALCLSCFYSLSTQFIVGKSAVVKRSNFLGFKSEKVFPLASVLSVVVGKLGGLKLKFRDGQKVTLYCYEPALLSHLPECENPPKLKGHEHLHRLKDEIKRCIENPSASDTKREEEIITGIQFHTMGLKNFVTIGIVVCFLFLAMAYQNHLQLVEKIKMASDQQGIRYQDVHEAFSLFKGSKFGELKKTWNVV